MRSLMVIISLLLTAASAQAVTIGAISSGGSGSRALTATSALTTIVNSPHPATEAGTVSRATIMWLSAADAGPNGSCANAFEVKFLRPSKSGPFTLTVVAERGPFDAVSARNVVTLSPPVAIEPGDLIAVTQLQDFPGCGGVLSSSADKTVSYFVSETDPALGATVEGMVLDHGLIPGIRASDQEDVLHGYLPVVGAVNGAFGSRFKTAIQLTNRSRSPLTGKLVFHPAGVPASPSDPALDFVLPRAEETLAFDDVMADIGRTGLGSMDVILTGGPPPDITVNIFNDQDAAGTAGFTTEVALPSQVLDYYTRATLAGPSDPANFRLNIGIRTLGSGARLRFSMTDDSGSLVAQGEAFNLPPNFFEQNGAAAYLAGLPRLPPNGTVSVQVLAGSAFVYGAITDNRTNDARFRLFQAE